MERRQRVYLVIPLLLLASTITFGDTLELRDGTTVEGRFLGQSQTEIQFEVAGEVKSFPIENVAALHFNNRMGTGVSLDLTSVNPSAYPIAIARKKEARQKKNKCSSDCSKHGEGDLGWGVACIDYCDCLHETDNTTEQCKAEFEDTTGQEPPFSVSAQETQCGVCAPLLFQVKTCIDKDALPPKEKEREDLLITVPCGQRTPASWQCRACLDAFSLQATCCTKTGTCWTEPCTAVSRPLSALQQR